MFEAKSKNPSVAATIAPRVGSPAVSTLSDAGDVSGARKSVASPIRFARRRVTTKQAESPIVIVATLFARSAHTVSEVRLASRGSGRCGDSGGDGADGGLAKGANDGSSSSSMMRGAHSEIAVIAARAASKPRCPSATEMIVVVPSVAA